MCTVTFPLHLERKKRQGEVSNFRLAAVQGVPWEERDKRPVIKGGERKALISQALVLWRDKPVREIRNYVDGDFARQFAEVLSGIKGPIFYYEKEDRITLRRWAEILIGEGKDSKDLSPGEEERLQTLAYDIQTKYNNSIITPKDLRELGDMGNTKSELVLSSSILKRWYGQGVLEKVGHGKYKFVSKVPAALTAFEDLLKIFSQPSATIQSLMSPGNEVGLQTLMPPSIQADVKLMPPDKE